MKDMFKDVNDSHTRKINEKLLHAIDKGQIKIGEEIPFMIVNNIPLDQLHTIKPKIVRITYDFVKKLREEVQEKCK